MIPDDAGGRWVPLKAAAPLLGLERDTLRKQLGRGERQGRRDNRGRWLAFVPDDAGIGPGREPAPAGTDAGTAAEAPRHDAGTVPDERERTIAVLRAQVEDLQDERDRLLALVEQLAAERRQRRPWPGLRRWLRRVWEGETG